jgi:EAL and modified HD-GYP domain-containing signal transduction protein
MALNSIFKSLLASSEQPQKLSIDEVAKQMTGPQSAARKTLQQSGPRAVLHREEIIDARMRIAGYRFYVDAQQPKGRIAQVAFIDAMKAEAVLSFAKRRLALIPIAAQHWQQANYQQFIAANTIFVVSAPTASEATDAWAADVALIKDAGARIGLEGPVTDAGLAPILALCDLAMVDFNDYSLGGLEQLVRGMRAAHPTVALAVENVPAWPERRLLVAQGVQYCLGGFTTEMDEEDSTDRLNQSRLVLIEMLNLLRSDADVAKLTIVAKRDPAVALHILSMANMPAAGLSKPVASLEQAVMVLGREQLYRWISVSMFRAGSNRPRDEALLELALSRARFLELIGNISKGKREADELFLVGLLSMLDCLLGVPMPQILARLALPKPVTDVLLRSDGEYARYLMLAITVERGRTESWMKAAELLDLSPEQIETASLSALAWAEEALQAPV